MTSTKRRNYLKEKKDMWNDLPPKGDFSTKEEVIQLEGFTLMQS